MNIKMDIFNAIEDQNISKIKRLIKNTPNCLYSKDCHDVTPLYVACVNNILAVNLLFNTDEYILVHNSIIIVNLLLKLTPLRIIKNIHYIQCQQYIINLTKTISSKTFPCTLINRNVKQYLDVNYIIIYLLIIITAPRDVNYLIENYSIYL